MGVDHGDIYCRIFSEWEWRKEREKKNEILCLENDEKDVRLYNVPFHRLCIIEAYMITQICCECGIIFI